MREEFCWHFGWVDISEGAFLGVEYGHREVEGTFVAFSQ